MMVMLKHCSGRVRVQSPVPHFLSLVEVWTAQVRVDQAYQSDMLVYKHFLYVILSALQPSRSLQDRVGQKVAFKRCTYAVGMWSLSAVIALCFF